MLELRYEFTIFFVLKQLLEAIRVIRFIVELSVFLPSQCLFHNFFQEKSIDDTFLEIVLKRIKAGSFKILSVKRGRYFAIVLVLAAIDVIIRIC